MEGGGDKKETDGGRITGIGEKVNRRNRHKKKGRDIETEKGEKRGGCLASPASLC